MLDPDTFLKQEIDSATPAKLRYLLLRKAVGLCTTIDQLWQANDFVTAQQWCLRVRDILNEMLNGVTDRSNQAAAAISDLYVYLHRLMREADEGRDRESLAAVREILSIELETWQMYVNQEMVRDTAGQTLLESAANNAPHFGIEPAEAMKAGLNLEA